MRALVWIVEDTWEATVAEAAAFLPADAEVTLLHVAPGDVETLAEGSRHGLLGRRRHAGPPEPPAPLRAISDEAADGAAGRGARAPGARRAAPSAAAGASGHEVAAAAEGMDLLVLARDGDHSRLGPRSLGPGARFAVDHAPCRVLLVWADAPPGVDTIPPPPASLTMQNVHAMRPEVARRLRARARARGRRRRLRHALRALLHRAARSARRRLRRRPALRRAVAGPARRDRPYGGRARPRAAHARPRARDHPGLAAARAGRRLRHLRRSLRRHAARAARAPALPARAGHQLPAPHAAAARAARAQRRRLRGRRLRRGRAGAGHDGRPPRAGRRAARGGNGAVHRRRAQPHRARAPVGAGRAGRRRAGARLLPDVPGPHRARRLRADPPRGLPRHRARQLHLGARARALGVDDLQRLPMGPRLLQPRGVPRDGGGDAGPGRRRRRRPAPRRRPLPVEAQGHELPEPAGGARAAAGVPGARCGSRRRRWRSRPRRSSPRATSSATSAPGATRARSATSPTTTCSWSWCGARWPRGA